MRRKRQGTARFLRMKTVLVLNLAVFGMVAWGFGSEYVRNRDLHREIDGLKAAADSLEVRNLELAVLRERFSGDSQMEREARLKLNLMRPGEQVVVIKELGQVPLGTEDAPREDRPPAEERSLSNVQKWFSYFLRETARDNDSYSSQ